ncbi:MAG TPA: hypothetical protein V6D08_13635 [Candidatus Obscuribacterales bacterium]
MQSQTVSFCDRCAYVLMGSFYRCMRCGAHDMRIYQSALDPDLIARVKKLRGYREPAGQLVSLLTVALLAGLLTLAGAIATADHPTFKNVRQQVAETFSRV